MMNYNNAVKHRRSIYGLGNQIKVSEPRIEQLISEAVMHTPSAFNSQSARVVLLYGEHHAKLWSIAKETLRKIVPAEAFPQTEQKLNSFAAGYGTVLYFEESETVKALQEKYPLYKKHFPVWAQQASGMLQYAVWTALSAEGLGASLQHYNPLIDAEVKKQWIIPDSWDLVAQMPFGAVTAPAGEKSFAPLDERLYIYK